MKRSSLAGGAANIAEQLADALTIAEAATELKVHYMTAHRWAVDGIKGIVLRSILLGGRRMVPRDAIGEFLQALNSHGQKPQRSRRVVASCK